MASGKLKPKFEMHIKSPPQPQPPQKRCANVKFHLFNIALGKNSSFNFYIHEMQGYRLHFLFSYLVLQYSSKEICLIVVDVVIITLDYMVLIIWLLLSS